MALGKTQLLKLSYTTCQLARPLKAWLPSLLLIAGLSVNLSAHAQLTGDASFEVGTAVIPATTTPNNTTATPFTRVTFTTPFEIDTTPNVFPMTPEFGTGAANDPCTIRIRNIDHTGFDATCLEPLNEDRDSPGFSFDYIAMLKGEVEIPIVNSTDTVRFESGCADVSSQQFGPNCANCTLNAVSYTHLTLPTKA